MVENTETGQPAKKQPWFQFHLSTLVLLTLVISGLMTLSFRPYAVPRGGWDGLAETLSEGVLQRKVGWGFPFCVCVDYVWVNPQEGNEETHQIDMSILGLAGNISIILIAGVALEGWTRWRRRERESAS